jgi:hypothetical protein
VSEQERSREGAERARAHLARAKSELEAPQRGSSGPGAVGRDRPHAGQGTRQRKGERRRRDRNGA